MNRPMRPITHRYRDPLDELWLEVARHVGLRVARSQEAYATTDGEGTLTVGTPASLDPDDCLAQMILHELCHALVQGPDAFDRPDWGLDNTSTRDLDREHAALRLQAALLDPVGLRVVLAPTTEHRTYYEALPVDPLALSNRAPEVVLARRGRTWADRPPFAPVLLEALDRTSTIVRTVAEALPRSTASLFDAVTAPRPTHPSTGFPLAAGGDQRAECGRCVFAFRDARTLRCRHAGGAPVGETAPACERFEAHLDCQACGACCREAYGAVEVDPGDPVIGAHPTLIVESDGRRTLRRVGMHCIALDTTGTYRCTIYNDRPQSCRDFERGGQHCLTARRRVGLSL